MIGREGKVDTKTSFVSRETNTFRFVMNNRKTSHMLTNCLILRRCLLLSYCTVALSLSSLFLLLSFIFYFFVSFFFFCPWIVWAGLFVFRWLVGWLRMKGSGMESSLSLGADSIVQLQVYLCTLSLTCPSIPQCSPFTPHSILVPGM
jgi:hypothetical protein